MQDFNESKYGYDKDEVESFIKQTVFDYEKRLQDQKERIFDLVENVKALEKQLENYKNKDDHISMALLGAVQKAKEIESAAQKRYDIEIQRLKMFHNKWVRYYKEIKEKYPVDTELMSVENFLCEMNKVLEFDGDEELEIKQTKPSNIAINALPNFLPPPLLSDAEVAFDKNALEATFRKEKERVNRGIKRSLDDAKPATLLSSSVTRKGLGAKPSGTVATLFDRFSASEASAGSRISPMARIGAYLSKTVKAEPNIGDSGFDLTEVLNPGTKLDLGALCRDLGLMEEE